MDPLFTILQKRFGKYPERHKGIKWPDVQAKLEQSAAAMEALQNMEDTGGEPDVVMFDKKKNTFIFFDCAPESPAGRRSLCYDRAALNARKEHKPKNCALDMAEEIGITLLTEEQYRYLQQLGNFDQKTSSWVQTPADIRRLGGALFCDRRYNTVFVYHNGADSYYAARGFRGALEV
ncbi:DUF4256 domain-containing protein [Nostoc sp. CMAA1605]|uniref:DUF4256 domain-containing protein n=1 Tax=Nostoc sp. CMAA1605 TaxID=2055159 RepID=UPI001F484117|nr:DUF4256 domain-containing protein [Nostoc sp. CMAA1605]MCF4970788.1 DUF4256 domain-containing protein [Nostoc sp. CMAA1605]